MRFGISLPPDSVKKTLLPGFSVVATTFQIVPATRKGIRIRNAGQTGFFSDLRQKNSNITNRHTIGKHTPFDWDNAARDRDRIVYRIAVRSLKQKNDASPANAHEEMTSCSRFLFAGKSNCNSISTNEAEKIPAKTECAIPAAMARKTGDSTIIALKNEKKDGR
jgi:hypothetical protein